MTGIFSSYSDKQSPSCSSNYQRLPPRTSSSSNLSLSQTFLPFSSRPFRVAATLNCNKTNAKSDLRKLLFVTTTALFFSVLRQSPRQQEENFESFSYAKRLLLLAYLRFFPFSRRRELIILKIIYSEEEIFLNK